QRRRTAHQRRWRIIENLVYSNFLKIRRKVPPKGAARTRKCTNPRQSLEKIESFRPAFGLDHKNTQC
ncbi:hypothetical protein, partial [Pseudomonas aeruginosa]|uniref:hypothetical protein n=1 Tax=Pseudomonas aeruginosa TaxID=287 RepID=UPI001968F42E